QHPVVDLHGQLAALGGHHQTRCADPVTQGKRTEVVESGRVLRAREQLDATRAVLQCAERDLSLHAPQHQAARDGHPTIGLDTGLEVRKLCLQVRSARVRLVAVGDVVAQPGRFFSKIRRKPCSVSQGSWYWIASE